MNFFLVFSPPPPPPRHVRSRQLRPITAFLLVPFYREKAKTGRNSQNRRAIPAESTLATSRLLNSDHVQFFRLYPHRKPGHKKHPTTVSSYIHFSREHFLGYPEYIKKLKISKTTSDQIRSHFSIRKFSVSFFLQK